MKASFYKEWKADTHTHDCQAREGQDKSDKNLPIPEKPHARIKQRRDIKTLGQQTTQVKNINKKRMESVNEFDQKARETWQERESQGIGSMHSEMQQKVAPALDDELIGKRIDYLAEFELDDKGTEKDLRWCSGVVERVCDGTWVQPGCRTKCYKVGEAAEMFWDPIPDADMPAHRSIEVLSTRKWN